MTGGAGGARAGRRAEPESPCGVWRGSALGGSAAAPACAGRPAAWGRRPGSVRVLSPPSPAPGPRGSGRKRSREAAERADRRTESRALWAAGARVAPDRRPVGERSRPVRGRAPGGDEGETGPWRPASRNPAWCGPRKDVETQASREWRGEAGVLDPAACYERPEVGKRSARRWPRADGCPRGSVTEWRRRQVVKPLTQKKARFYMGGTECSAEVTLGLGVR